MIVVLLHAAATLAMTGLIWFVQLVHYPLFELASERRFERFAASHQRRTSWVVVPLMLVEVATAVVLAAAPPPGVSRTVAFAGLALLAVVWLTTAVVQVPLHRRLVGGYDGDAVRRLVATNWIRTAVWSARCGVVLWMVVGAAR